MGAENVEREGKLEMSSFLSFYLQELEIPHLCVLIFQRSNICMYNQGDMFRNRRVLASQGKTTTFPLHTCLHAFLRVYF